MPDPDSGVKISKEKVKQNIFSGWLFSADIWRILNFFFVEKFGSGLASGFRSKGCNESAIALNSAMVRWANATAATQKQSLLVFEAFLTIRTTKNVRYFLIILISFFQELLDDWPSDGPKISS
jgi:hypothetical protein